MPLNLGVRRLWFPHTTAHSVTGDTCWRLSWPLVLGVALVDPGSDRADKLSDVFSICVRSNSGHCRSFNHRLERTVTVHRWRAASALRCDALASRWTRLRPAAQPDR